METLSPGLIIGIILGFVFFSFLIINFAAHGYFNRQNRVKGPGLKIKLLSKVSKNLEIKKKGKLYVLESTKDGVTKQVYRSPDLNKVIKHKHLIYTQRLRKLGYLKVIKDRKQK